MKIAVWIVSGVLAAWFVMSGIGGFMRPTDDVITRYDPVPLVMFQLSWVAQILGGLGLVLPALTRILPILTPIAASGLVLTMVGAVIVEIIVGGFGVIPMIAILGGLSAFVAWARFVPYAIEPRSA
jgi:uncharacterized membrane protein